jgi:hypothetical protein
MSDVMQCFTIEELEALDEHQVNLLRFAIQRDVRTNPDIHKIIRGKFGPMYQRMAAGRAPRKAAGRKAPRKS